MRDRPDDQHRAIASRKMGRPLRTGEDVSHNDDNKANNDPSNLTVMAHGEHSRHTATTGSLRRLRKALTMHHRKEKLYTFLLACLLSITMACAPILAPIPATPTHLLPVGLNDGFHAPLLPSVVATYCGTTIRTPQLTIDGVAAYYASIASCPSMHTILLVEAPDAPLVRTFAALLHDGDFVEAGNELELLPHELTLDQYATFIHDACVPSMITGGIYTLNDDTKARLLAAHAACPSARLGLHLYQPLTQDDVDWLSNRGPYLVNGGIGSVHLVITETGFPTRCDPARDPLQRIFLTNLRSLLSTIPTIDAMIVYQRPIGPSCSDLDTFGIDEHEAMDLFRH